MEPKLNLDNMTAQLDDDHMYGYNPSTITVSDTITLSSLNYSNTISGGGITTAGKMVADRRLDA
jgi:hypothetical protein